MSKEENFNLDIEIKALRAKMPRAVHSAAQFKEALNIIDEFMDDIEGKIIPQYLYRISDSENHEAYLLGTQHATDSKVFTNGLFDLIKKCKIFVTEAKLLENRIEDTGQDEGASAADSEEVKLPKWAKNLSRYDQNFLKALLKEYQVTYVSDASPQEIYDIIHKNTEKIIQKKAMDKKLAEYFQSHVEGGKLSWLEDGLDREEAEKLQYQRGEEAADSSIEDKYYINAIDKHITDLCDGQNYSFIHRLIRWIYGTESTTLDIITSTHKYLKGEVLLDQDPATDQRTTNWLEQIDKLICNEDPAFIAVGVQHFIGEAGILHHFEQKYSIEHILLDA